MLDSNVKCYGLIHLDIPQNNILHNCFFIWIYIEVCFFLTFGEIVGDHYVLLCLVAVYKCVHNKIKGMDMGVQKEMQLVLYGVSLCFWNSYTKSKFYWLVITHWNH